MAANDIDTLTASAPEPVGFGDGYDGGYDADEFDFDEPRKPSLLRRIVVKVRLLPMVIFFATLTLTVRVGDIWDGVDGFLNGTYLLYTPI